MNPRESMRSASQIALIRTLQLERKRLEAQRVAARAHLAQNAAISAQTQLDAQMECLRNALRAQASIAPNLVSNFGAAVEAARVSAGNARHDANHVAELDRRERAAFARSQQLAELAESIVSHTTRRYARACEQRLGNAIEESLRARECSS